MLPLKAYATNYWVWDVAEEKFDKLSKIVELSKKPVDEALPYINSLKSLYNQFRESQGMECVVSLMINDEDRKAVIILFELIAANDTMYTVHYDEEKRLHYIEV